jgi:uncharacterized protein (TIGR02996 family)
MDQLAQHEAFLRAIFDAPDDDTPRLVYADFLDETGDPERAERIRVQCELERLPPDADPARRKRLEARSAALSPHRDRPAADLFWPRVFRRGFDLPGGGIRLAAEELADPVALRWLAVRECPEWYAETRLAIDAGRAVFPDELPVLFDLPFTRQVTDWNLGGHVEELEAGPQTADAGTFALIDLSERPVLNTAGVEALARCRGARRVRTLILTHNRLGNDAARALIRSPYLDRLTRLDISEGNRFSGQVWGQLRERFGADVVG